MSTQNHVESNSADVENVETGAQTYEPIEIEFTSDSDQQPQVERDVHMQPS